MWPDLDLKRGPGSIDAHVTVLHGKSCIDVLGEQRRVDHIPRERRPGVADVDVHRGSLRPISCSWNALALEHWARPAVPVGVAKPASARC